MSMIGIGNMKLTFRIFFTRYIQIFYIFFQEINIAYASGVLVLSFTHTGEPGYTLIIPAEYTLHIYRQLMKVSIM